MNKKVLVTALALGLGASSAMANPPPGLPLQLTGSDTLRELTRDIVSACAVGGPAGSLSANINYVGGGSSFGGVNMNPVNSPPDGFQQVAAQSRFLSTAECNAVAAGRGQGHQVALDGLSIFHDNTELTECGVLRYAGCMEVPGFGTPGYQCPNCVDTAADPDLDADEYCFTSWADIVRIIYNGQHGHLFFGAAPGTDASTVAGACNGGEPTRSPLADKRCNSTVRRTLVNTWSNMFDTAGDDGAGGCSDENCVRLKHAWRRDDLSGTTDAFLTLIGAPGVGAGFNVRTFCSGLENEDLDPIRRPCAQNFDATGNADPDAVCNAIPFKYRNAPIDVNGNPTGGSTATPPTDYDILPTIATLEEDVPDLGLVLPISLPTNTALQYDDVGSGTGWCSGFASGGAFFPTPMPAALTPATQVCPDGSGRNGGQCQWPRIQSGARAGQWNCMNRRTNRFAARQWFNYDGRVYNMMPRDPITGAVLQPNNGAILDPRWSTAGAYRISQKRSNTALPGHPSCKLQDATTQIGCLVQSDPCSIGFAGLEAEDVDASPEEIAVLGTNAPFLMRSPLDTNTAETNPGDDTEVEPLLSTIQRLVAPSGASCESGTGDFDIRFPMARILWFTASKGFGPGGVGGWPVGIPNITNVVNDSNGAPLNTRENDLAQCYANRSLVDPLVDAHGFIRLPPAAVYPDSSRLRDCP